MKTINIQIDDETSNDIQDYCDEFGIDIAEAVEAWISNGLIDWQINKESERLMEA